jgi:hypothetical protein
LLWPYDELSRYLHLMPLNARIEVRAGPLAQGDLEDVPYTAYVAYAAEPMAEPPPGYLARFGDQIALVNYAVELREREWRVRLEWEALTPPVEDYTVFVHLRDGEHVVAQDDGEPAEGYYPTSLWRGGDVIVDTRVLDPPDEWESDPRLVVGLYAWPTMERLRAVTSSGESLPDEFVLSIGDER